MAVLSRVVNGLPLVSCTVSRINIRDVRHVRTVGRVCERSAITIGHTKVHPWGYGGCGAELKVVPEKGPIIRRCVRRYTDGCARAHELWVSSH